MVFTLPNGDTCFGAVQIVFAISEYKSRVGNNWFHASSVGVMGKKKYPGT